MTKEEQKVFDMVEGFAKANPETIERLRKDANRILNPYKAEMTASELEAAKVAFCLGGVWGIIRISLTNKPSKL